MIRTLQALSTLLLVACATRAPAPRTAQAPTVERFDLLCPENEQIDAWRPPASWRIEPGLTGSNGQTVYSTPHGQQTLCNFSRQVAVIQEEAARLGQTIPYPLGVAKRDAYHAQLTAAWRDERARDLGARVADEQHAQDFAEAEAARQAEQAERARVAAQAEADARAYAAANVHRLAGVHLCSLNAEEASWRGDIRAEKRAGAVSGYVDKSSLYQAGVEIVRIADERAAFIRRTTSVTGRAPACDVYARGVLACADDPDAPCSREQYLARNALPFALETIRAGNQR